MSKPIFWNLRLAIRDGQLENTRELVKDLAEAARNDPGVLDYGWYFNRDGTECHSVCRFRDSDAIVAHIDDYGSRHAERFVQCMETIGWTTYGELSDDARGALKAVGAREFEPVAGFVREGG